MDTVVPEETDTLAALDHAPVANISDYRPVVRAMTSPTTEEAAALAEAHKWMNDLPCDQLDQLLVIIRAQRARDEEQFLERVGAKDARIEALERAGRNITPYLDWTIGRESPGCHPTMPSAVAAFRAALTKVQADV